MTSHLPRLMVSSEQGDPIRMLDLETQQIFEGLDRVVASINKISDEDVASLLDLST